MNISFQHTGCAFGPRDVSMQVPQEQHNTLLTHTYTHTHLSAEVTFPSMRPQDWISIRSVALAQPDSTQTTATTRDGVQPRYSEKHFPPDRIVLAVVLF